MAAVLVMVVDDDVDVRESLCELLEAEGYLTDSAANGLEALQHLRATKRLPDLILLDLMMPVMDGWTFSQLQSQDPSLAQIPVVAMTAGGSEQRREPGWRTMMRKPLFADRLLLTIRTHCANPAT